MWYNGKKKRPGCIRSPGIYLTTFYENGLRLNRVALSKKSDSAEHPSQTAYVLKQVLEGHQLRALTPVGVHIVVDGDVADAEHGEPLLDVKPRVELVTPQPGQILGDDGADLPVFHIRHHLLEAGAVEAAPGIAIIHIKAGVGEAVLPCVPLQDIPLR